MEDNKNTRILKGEDAGLLFLHLHDPAALSCALANLEVILGPLPVEWCLITADPSSAPNNNNNDNTNSNDNGHELFSSGLLLVTKQALLFWRNISDENKEDEKTACQHDLLVPGSSIDLHAITADGEDGEGIANGIYLQINNSGGDDGDLLELNIQPKVPELCEEIYRAVASLIELHPHAISDDEEDENDEMIMATDFLPSFTTITTTAASTSPTAVERELMLERLSNLLIVPTEFEISDGTSSDDGVEGQFDDADDDAFDQFM